jgi:HK97 family phage prohead protease
MTIEQGFHLELDTKAVTEAGEFLGYASIFGNEDLGRDVVVAGAFTKSLARRPAGKVKMLRGHYTDEPIGVWTGLTEDSRGLKAQGKLILDTTKGRETHALMRAGALDGLSIGFRTLKDKFDRTKGIRFVEEVDLVEISVVTFPANPKAVVSAVKSQEATERARALVAQINRLKEAYT